MMSTTLAQLTQICYDILREEWPSSSYPQSLMELFCNSAQQDILAWRIIHPFTKQEATAGDLHFLNWDAYYNNVDWTSLTSDATIGDVVLNVADTSEFPATWCLYLWGQIVEYTWKTPTTFTGVTPLLFGFIGWTMVSIAFALPTDFSDILNVIYNNKIKLPAKQYDDIFEDLNNYKWSLVQKNWAMSIYESPYRVKPFYTIKDAQYLIIYQLNQTWTPIHLRYRKLAPTMTSIQWPIIDNDIYAQLTIPYLAVAEMLFNRWEEARAWDLYNVAISHVSKMYSYYNDTTYESQNGVHYSMGWGKVNI